MGVFFSREDDRGQQEESDLMVGLSHDIMRC